MNQFVLRAVASIASVLIPCTSWAQESPKRITNSIGMELRQISAGNFVMGAESLYRDTRPAHPVTLSRSFYLGTHEVTQQQYEQVLEHNPSKTRGAMHPVENVTWDDAVRFCRRLTARSEEKAAGRVYRLPTEAEWEYACRAGTTTKFSFGEDEKLLNRHAWYHVNSDGGSHPVGQKKPNPWGLYDMHGNVEEWCQDWYGDYPATAQTDPTGAATGSFRVVRGGGWSHVAPFLPAAYRGAVELTERSSSLGFRVACTIEPQPQRRLKFRKQMSLDDGRDLWRDTNVRLGRATEGSPGP